jgi:hypothetical protein
MRLEVPSELPKLGQRPYVQGGTIFNGILEVCDRALGDGWLVGTTIPSFKLEREAVANGRIVVADSADDNLDSNATFVARRPAGPLYGYFIDDGREARSIPYDESSYYRVLDVNPRLEGRFAFAGGRPRADFMRGIVGANKLVHQKTDRFGCELTQIQFLYLKGLDAVCLCRVNEDYEVAITNATVQDRGREVWSINRVHVRGGSFDSEFRICYRAQRQALKGAP